MNVAIPALCAAKDRWAQMAARRKLLPENAPLAGEEWLSGPYALMSACNGLMRIISEVKGKRFLNHPGKRKTATGPLAVKVPPHSIRKQLLLSGVKAEGWMREGVDESNLAAHTACAWDEPAKTRRGKVALVPGAGNIAAISPPDGFQELFSGHQMLILPGDWDLKDKLLTSFQHRPGWFKLPRIFFEALRG